VGALTKRVGADRIHMGHNCVAIAQESDRVSATFEHGEDRKHTTYSGSIMIGCDGVHSLVRKSLYPTEGPPIYHGINLWRGVTRQQPFLTGASIARVGAMRSTIIIYPIRDNVDEAGNQLVNWVAEVDSEKA